MRSGSPLVSSGRAAAEHLADRMPRLPTGWQVIADAGSVSATERFCAFHRVTGIDATGTDPVGAGMTGAIVTMHAVKLGTDRPAHTEPRGRLIALVTFDPQRVSIAEAGPDRFDARWQCAGIAYRLHAGPTTLGSFMQLMMAATWA